MTGKTSHIYRYSDIFIFFCLFLLACTLIQITNGLSWASLEKSSVLKGEIWRVLTAHMTHSNWKHFGLNMLGSGLCLYVFRSDVPLKDWISSALLISLFSSTCMLLVFFDHTRYIGFSDTLYGWITIGILYMLPKETLLAIGMLILLIARVIYEFYVPESPFEMLFEGSKVAKESHLYGLIGGTIYSFIFNKKLRLFIFSIFKKA